MSFRDTARKISVLVVDDDPDDRMVAKDELSKHPMVRCVDVVEDGVEMLSYLRNCTHTPDQVRRGDDCIQKPDLILLDLQMPRMNGCEAMEKLKSLNEFRDIPIIIFSTSICVEDIEQCYRMGASTYVNKPDSYSQLMETMHAIGDYWSRVACLPPTRFYCPATN